jgi:hypothetical protein
MVAGIVSASVGGLLLITGGVMIGVGMEEDYNDTRNFGVIRRCRDEVDFDQCEGVRNGVIVFAVGVAAAGVGIPLAIVGGRKVPSEPAQPEVQPYAGLDGVGLRGRF